MSYTSFFSFSGGRDRGREEGSEGGAFVGKRRNFLISAVRRGRKANGEAVPYVAGRSRSERKEPLTARQTQRSNTTRLVEKVRKSVTLERKCSQLSLPGQKFLELKTGKSTRRSGILTHVPSAGPSSLTSSLAGSPGRPAFTYPLRPLSPARLQTALTCSPRRRRRTKTKGPRKQRERKK